MTVSQSSELRELIAHRQALGLDGFDEVWEGVYHLAPYRHSDHGLLQVEVGFALRDAARRSGLLVSGPFNLGVPTDFRVPDGGFLRSRAGTLYVPTAAVVVEIVSPEDETYRKLPFYAARGVEEVLVVLPEEQQVRCLDLTSGEPVDTEASTVLDVAMATLTSAITWPGAES